MSVTRIVLNCNAPSDHPSPGGSHPTAGGGMVIAAPITHCFAEFTARCNTVDMARMIAADTTGWVSDVASSGRRVALCPKHAPGFA